MDTRDSLIVERQSALGLNVPNKAMIVGVGGTGSWVALLLAMMGTPRLVLVDPDDVEIHNLNRLPLPLATVGSKKVDAVAQEIERYRPSIHCAALGTKFMPVMLRDMDFDVVFDCTDNTLAQQEIHGACKHASARYVRCGCSATEFSATTRLPWVNGNVSGYGASIPIWAAPAMLAAAYAVGVDAGQWPEFSGPIGR